MKKGIFAIILIAIATVFFAFFAAPEVVFSQGPDPAATPSWMPDLCLPDESQEEFDRQVRQWCQAYGQGTALDCSNHWYIQWFKWSISPKKKAEFCAGKPAYVGATPTPLLLTATPTEKLVPPPAAEQEETEGSQMATPSPTVTATATPTPTVALVPPLPTVIPVDRPASRPVNSPSRPQSPNPPFWKGKGFEGWAKFWIAAAILGLAGLSMGWEGLQNVFRGEGEQRYDPNVETKTVGGEAYFASGSDVSESSEPDYLERMGLR